MLEQLTKRKEVLKSQALRRAEPKVVLRNSIARPWNFPPGEDDFPH